MNRVCWVDGRVVSLDAPVVRGDDSAFMEGRGCYSSMRVTGGKPRWAERHASRVQQAAAALEIGELDPGLLLHAFETLAVAAFDDGEGVLRFQASRDGQGRIHVVGVPRDLGPDVAEWSAVVAPFTHEGFTPYGGRKVSSRLLHALAIDVTRHEGVEEALLFDASDRLVEGAHTNLFAVTEAGALVTPPLDRGAVAGLARTLAMERIPEAIEADVPRADLARVRELIAVNAVRGARPIVRVDATPIADGRPGPYSARLAEALDH
jgi:branched-subunit amino acid aminotransferase/4-amino-4-deoxychorismate lyase